MHAGLVLQMDTAHEHVLRVAEVVDALPEDFVLTPCILDHRVDEGCFIVQGQSLDELALGVSGVYKNSLPAISIDITHSQPLTESWVEPLFKLVQEDEAKQMNPNAADLAIETNCTVFVMQALRRLGGGGVVDLSQEAVERHIRRVGVAEATAREAATTWLRLWGSFLAQPQPQVDGGFRKQLKPVLQPILGVMLQRAAGAAGGGASSSGAAAAAQPGAFGRKRKHAGS